MRKPRKPGARNDFTDALNAEISARKIIERTQVERFDESFLAEFQQEVPEKKLPTETALKNKPVKKSPAKKKIKQKKVVEPKNISPPQNFPEEYFPNREDLPADSEFEQRIYDEADNDFYEENIPKNIGANMRSIRPKDEAEYLRKKNYYSKVFAKLNEDEDLEEEIEQEDELEKSLNRKLSHAETAGLALSAVMLIYSFSTLDKPLFFMAMSLFSFLVRPLIGGLCGKYNRSVQNALHAFSITVFFGALLFMFT